MKKLIPIASLLGILFSCVLPGGAAAFTDIEASPQPEALPLADTVLGEVDGLKVKVGDINPQVDRGLLRSLGRDAARAALRQAVMSKIDLLLQEREARRRGLFDSPRYTVPLTIFSEEKLADAFMREYYAARLEPTEEELKAVLPQDWTAIHARVIYFRTREDAEKMYDRIRSGKDRFEEMTKELTAIKTPNGGDLGWVLRGKSLFGPEVEELLFALEAGEISPVVDVQIGAAVVKVADKRELSPPEQMEIRQNAALSLRSNKLSDHVEELKSAYKLKIDDGALDSAAKKLLAYEGKSDLVVADLMGTKITFRDLVNSQGRPIENVMVKPTVGKLTSGYKFMIQRAHLSRAVADEARGEGFTIPASVTQKMAATLTTRVLGGEILAGVTVTAKELREHYDNNPDMYLQPEMFAMRRIITADRAKADRLKKMLDEAPDSFPELSEKHSEEPFEEKHGTGAVNRYPIARFPAQARDLLRGTAQGEITPVLENDGRYYIFRVEERLLNYQVPFEDAEWESYKRILGIKQAPVIAAFMEELRGKADITIHEEALKKVVKEARQ